MTENSAIESRNPPSSLKELQEMDAEEFRKVEKYLWHGELSAKRVIQHIIMLAERELDWKGQENANSLRDFWYNPTKPILERAFPEKVENPSFKFSRRMSQYLSETMSEMVKEGRIAYRDLNILDDSRSRRLNVDSIEGNKILFVEKEAAYRKLKPLEETYELNIVSGSGWQATALIEDLAHELDNSEEYTFYVLSDYDPTGFRISKDMASRSEKLGISVKDVIRLGIDPEQVDEETLENQKFSPPMRNDYEKQWAINHGIDGKYGLEIEAIGDLNEKGKALREMVVEVLRDDIKEKRRYEKDTNIKTANVASFASSEVVGEITDDLERELKEEACRLLRKQQGVNTVRVKEMGTVAANVDMEACRDNEYLPDPPEWGDIHEAAVDGTYSGPSTYQAKKKVKEVLKQKIASGEIDVAELLDVEGGN